MALHFSGEEFALRRKIACEAMAAEKLDGLVIFRQESMYYLSGYDTSGYSMFQGMYLGADGRLALLTRSADRLQAEITSIVPDVRVWVDREGANPSLDLRDMLEAYGCRGKRLGVEYHAYGLTAQRGKMVDAALSGFCDVVDASDLIRVQRLIKSESEIQYFRKAGALADESLAISAARTYPGAHTGAIYGEMINAVMRGDGDPSASRWPLGAGEAAMLVRYHTGHECIAVDDQVQFEVAASYRHYHAALMYIILTGQVRPRHRDMFWACSQALAAARSASRSGNIVGDIFAAHAHAFTEAGFGECYLNVCGYTMGATYPPTWMDSPMIQRDDTQLLQPNMVFFLHMILLDRENGLSMSLGETVRIMENECERLTHAPCDLIVN